MQPGLAEARTPDLHAGGRPIPGFSLVRRRGRGGFGEVWEAEAPGGFLVALKFVRLSSRARDAELRALDFVRAIHHPNLLANFGSWQVDDTLVIGMELADRSLWDRFVEATRQGLRGIPGAELLGYLAEVAAGVNYLNEYRHTVDGRGGVGIQHRDLKPPNILLFGGGAKVADLGLARAMEGEVEGHTGIWTYPYAAPEFFRGETARQSDQYGLAVTYCQLRGGRLPFGGNAASVTAGHLFGRPDLDALPEAERPIVGRALAKEPADRWPDCRAFVDALRALPRETFEDVLVDPEGPADLAGDCPTSGPPLIDLALDSDLGGAGAPRPGPTSSSGAVALPSSFPLSGDSSADGAPTLILASGRRPGPASRRPLGLRAAATMTSAAAILAGVLVASSGVPAPAHDRSLGLAGRRLTPAGLVLARGIGAAAEAESPPSAPGPSVPLPPSPPAVGATTAAAADPEPIELEPLSTPGLAADSPRPAISRTDRPPLLLEGPVEMEAVRAAALAGPAGPRLPEPPSPGGPGLAAVAAPKAAGPTAHPPAVRPDPRPADLAAARGKALLHEGAYARAVAEFDAALRLDPGHVAARLSRAIARHRSGDLAGALGDYSESIRLRPGLALAHVSRGQAYHDVGSYDRAVADYDAAIRLRPDDADARLRLGLARYRSGDFEGAADAFAETLRLDPKNARAAELQADCLARVGSREPRIAAARSGTRSGPPTPSASLDPTPPPPVPAAEMAATAEAGSAGRGAGSARETSLYAPPDRRERAAAPAAGSPRATPPPARPSPNPPPGDRRRPILRILIPRPFQKPK